MEGTSKPATASVQRFHDILHPDGTPHLPQEAAFLRRITGRANGSLRG